MNIAFFGAGHMGVPMALNLVRAGHHVSAFNRTAARLEPLAHAGATIARSAADAAADADVAVTMLSNDAAVRAVLLESNAAGPAAIDRLPRGAIHMGMSTVSIALSTALAREHAARGQGYVAAPVLGRPEAAAEKKLWVIAAGRADDIDRCRPVADALGRGLSVMGEEPWQANLAKIGVNFLIASMIEALGESFVLLRKSGMDPRAFLDVVNALFNSAVYANYGRLLADRRYQPAAFQLALGLKDIGLALEAARTVEAPMPLAGLLHDHFLSAMAHGRGGWDWSALAEVAAQQAGLDAPDQR